MVLKEEYEGWKAYTSFKGLFQKLLTFVRHLGLKIVSIGKPPPPKFSLESSNFVIIYAKY